MYRRDRDAQADAGRDAYDDDAWEEDRDERPRPRKGVFRRVFSLVKLAIFVTPLAIFLYGNFVADCSARPSFTGGWTGFIGAGACARKEVIGSAFSMQDNFAALKRLID